MPTFDNNAAPREVPTMNPTANPSTSLGEADHLSVAVTNLDRHCAIWELLGYERVAFPERGVPSPSGAPAERFLAIPSVTSAPTSTRPRGGVRLVQAGTEATRPDFWTAGPDAIDLYTRDLDRSVALAEQAGVRIGGGLELPLGPTTRMRQRMLLPGDDVHIVLVEITTRRPSVLDSDHNRLHSEVQSVMTPVASCDDSIAFWSQMGIPKGSDFTLPVPGLDTMMHVPKGAAVRMTLHAQEAMAPIRLEFMEVVGASTPRALTAGADLAGASTLGRPVPVFITSEPTVSLTKAVDAGAVVCHQQERWCASGTRLRALLLAPDGLPFELHSSS